MFQINDVKVRRKYNKFRKNNKQYTEHIQNVHFLAVMTKVCDYI